MSKQKPEGTAERADIVIVGNGIAGLTAALEARRLEPEKSVVIITNQSHPTINTPALKQFAIGKLQREQLLAYPAGTERTQRIHLVNASVEEIHAQEGYVRLAGGQGFGYGSLLLATGSRPTGLGPEMPGQDFDGVMTLHRLYDYLDLRRRLSEVEEAVVIGGGAHAIETVMGMLYWGIRVHWLIRSETFMPRMLDRQASDMVLEGTRRAGAKVYTETEVVGIVGRVGTVAGVVTTTQQLLPCQLVLVCTGTGPVTALARTCDLPMKHDRGGILVDDQLRTSARNIYAAGDVASLRDPLTGKYGPRPQWYAAVLQGRAAAASMLGDDEPTGFGVPWHATRLGDLSMLTVGNPLAWPETITPLREKRKGSYCLLSLVDDRLVGYLSLGSSQPDSLAIKRIIDEGLSVREITKDLLRGEFDARKYFSGKRTYAVQRMITTGQLPTPLPPVPGLIGGESHAARLPAPRGSQPLPDPGATPRRGETAQIPAISPMGVNQDTHPRETVVRANTAPPARKNEDQRSATAPRIVAQQGDTGSQGRVAPPRQATGPYPAQRPPERIVYPAAGDAWVNGTAPRLPQDGADWLNDTPAGRPRETGELHHPTTEPLVRPTRTGSRSMTGPHPPVRETEERKRRIADQKTLINSGPMEIQAGQTTLRGGGPEEVELIPRTPERQFIAPPGARHTPSEEKDNPHPSRSLWHYTDKHPAIKGKKHV